ncbi:hypothetical protein [Micromonospora sp. NPDC092111]|uniref:hypothetical protein n=1 Tax=Micromonospora sp. NPDC092111 TaxID=3364289 RepID=UPI003801B2E7
MPSTFGQWLIVILALLVGLAGGWLLRGRRTPDAAPSIVAGDPVVGLSTEEQAAATVDTPRPAATVDATPVPVAVVDEPTAHDLETPPAAASLAASHTALPTGDAPADGPTTPDDADRSTPADEATVAPVAEPVAADELTSPVPAPRPAVEEDTPTVDAELPPTEAVPTEATPDAAPAEVAPTEAAPAEAAPAAAAPVVPTQRASVEDAAPTAGPDETADDFRRIQGVGPKMAAALQAAGIRTYRQLADLDEAGLRETIRAAGLRATPSLATWPQQAKVLAGAGAEAEQVLPTSTGSDSQG